MDTDVRVSVFVLDAGACVWRVQFLYRGQEEA